MRKLDIAWLAVLSEILANLAAAWFGLVIVTPTLAGVSSETLFALATNVSLGTLSLVFAVKLRRLAQGYNQTI